jgi:hypothetical protein
VTLALILLKLRRALPFLRRYWKPLAVLAILAVFFIVSCRRENAAERRGDAQGYARATGEQKAAYEAALTRQRAQQNAANAAAYQAGFNEGLAQRKIETVTKTIIQRIPTYVTREADAACPIPLGFVRAFDAAASGDPAAGDAYRAPEPDAAASGVVLSEIATVSAGNAGACHANAIQLEALQDVVRKFQALQQGE